MWTVNRFPNTRQPDWDWWRELWTDPEEVLRQLDVAPGRSLADVGCGNGYFALPAAELVTPAPVYAIDLEESLLEELAAAADDRDLSNVRPIAGDARELGALLPEPVDVLLVANTFHGVEEPTAFAEQAHRSLRPGGRFVVVNWHDRPPEESIVDGEPRGPPAERRLTPAETRRLLSSVPFERIDRRELPPHHYALVCKR